MGSVGQGESMSVVKRVGVAASPSESVPMTSTKSAEEGMEKKPSERRRKPSKGKESAPADSAAQDAAWHEMGSTRILPGGDTPPTDALENTRHEEDTAIVSSPQESSDASILGDFRLSKKLGEGAMGEVYKARQISFNRDVALKVLFPHVASNPKLVERLHREGRVMNQLSHPNIVEAYGVGKDQVDGETYHYVAMEFIDGDSLQKWLNRIGKLDLADAIAVTITVAGALGYAHEQGLVHRDIKPDNILITKKGVVKVADFGMVKTADEDMHLTQTGHAVGTPWYMPLEQARNAKETDGRSDIYALGCMLYCMVTGNPPFTGRTIVEVIQAKEVGTFPPARSGNPDVPERLDLIIFKMTAKAAKYRYDTCAEVIRDLQSLNLVGEKLQFVTGATPKRTTNLGKPSGSAGASIATNVDVWYVSVTHDGGESSLTKLNTSQVKKMLGDGSLSPTAKASRQTTEGFRALATYKEFQGSALSKASKQAADVQGARYRTLMRKIEEEDKHREEKSKSQERKSDARAPYWQDLWMPALWVGGGILVLFFLWYVATGLLN